MVKRVVNFFFSYFAKYTMNNAICLAIETGENKKTEIKNI